MSTFGKKAINWWTYDNHEKTDVTRWLHTPRDVQLKILKKWFPIGMKVIKYSRYWNRYEKTMYEVIGYSERRGYLALKVDSDNKLASTDSPDIIPVMAKPIDEDYYKIKREIKLNKIFR